MSFVQYLEGCTAPSEPASHNGGGVLQNNRVSKAFRKFWRMEGE